VQTTAGEIDDGLCRQGQGKRLVLRYGAMVISLFVPLGLSMLKAGCSKSLARPPERQ
jgi:hypothetical protein